MTKYLVVCRPSDQAVAHAEDTPEEAVCNIARTLMNLPMRADQLMAIPADTDLATMSLLKDDVMCSVDVTEKSIETWRNDVTNIQDAINSFQSAKDHAENVLDRALADLDDAYENSTGFNGYTPSNDISVYGALSEMGADDLEYAFQRALMEMYKFHVIQHERF
jgi:hypothetical protein